MDTLVPLAPASRIRRPPRLICIPAWHQVLCQHHSAAHAWSPRHLAGCTESSGEARAGTGLQAPIQGQKALSISLGNRTEALLLQRQAPRSALSQAGVMRSLGGQAHIARHAVSSKSHYIA